MTAATRRRRGGGPRNHVVTRTDLDTVLSVSYPWGNQHGDGAWKCLCGSIGPDAAAAAEHLRVKARAAFARLDDLYAFTAALVTDDNDRDAMTLIAATRAWHSHPGLRRHMTPYYDHVGCLAARLDFAGVAADVEAGRLTAEYPSDLLVLRIALSLAGVPIVVNLGELWGLPQDSMRHVREVLTRNLRLDGEG